MSITTTDSHSHVPFVWIQREGRLPMRVFIAPDIQIIEDLKEMMYGRYREYYATFYREQDIDEGSDIPNDTSSRQTIQFKRYDHDRCKLFLLMTFALV